MSTPSTVDISRLRRAFTSTRSVLATVGPEHLSAPTPCTSWDVAALVDHFIGSARWISATILDRPAPTGQGLAASDFLAAYDTAAHDALACLADLDATATFGGLPLGALLDLSTQDQFIHGWDLARALGASTDLDPALAQDLLTHARTWRDDRYRGPDGVGLFGPETPAPPDATPADRLAAFLGRSV